MLGQVSRSFLQKGHGNGRDQMVRVETTKPEDLSPANPPLTPVVVPPAERTARGQFTKGNRACKLPRVKIRPDGSIANSGFPAEYNLCMKWGRKYATVRRTELMQSHGGEISAGVACLVESAAMCKADARYTRVLALREKKGRIQATMLKQAAGLDNEARMHELAAWELAAREAKARPQKSAHEALMEALGGSPAVVTTPVKE